MAESGRYYNRGGMVVHLTVDHTGSQILKSIKASGLPAAFESVARIMRLTKGDYEAAICNEATARLIRDSHPFIDALPPVQILSPCPVLIERDGALLAVTSYDRRSGVLVTGGRVDEMTLADAKDLLYGIMADFDFASRSDRARALAAIITPALVFGDLLGGRAPVDLGEADDSQTGKGYRNKVTAAIYGRKVRTVTQKRGNGVGSLEESFANQIVKGESFIAFDNMRGIIDSPMLESFLTEDTFAARIPYQGEIEVDPSRTYVMLTSNQAELTVDFANRCSAVRIRKRQSDYRFQKFEDGIDLLEHVRRNQARYLGAVFAIIKAWHAAGKPIDEDAASAHDFRRWAGVLGWIVKNLLDSGDLLTGHREAQRRMANPSLTWLRSVAGAVKRAGKFDAELRPHDLLDILHEDPVATVPGWKDERDISNEPDRLKGMQAIGRSLGRCFSGQSTTFIDAFTVTRASTTDDQGRPRHVYVFSEPSVQPHSPNSPEGSRMVPPAFPNGNAIPRNSRMGNAKSIRTDNPPSICCSVNHSGIREDSETIGDKLPDCPPVAVDPVLLAVIDAGDNGTSPVAIAEILSMDPKDVALSLQDARREGLVALTECRRKNALGRATEPKRVVATRKGIALAKPPTHDNTTNS